MNTEAIATLALAGVAIAGSIGSALLLAFRVGKLTSSVEARISEGEKDRRRIWKALGKLVGKVDRHIETKHG